jgi:hypothetical protein
MVKFCGGVEVFAVAEHRIDDLPHRQHDPPKFDEIFADLVGRALYLRAEGGLIKQAILKSFHRVIGYLDRLEVTVDDHVEQTVVGACRTGWSGERIVVSSSAGGLRSATVAERIPGRDSDELVSQLPDGFGGTQEQGRILQRHGDSVQEGGGVFGGEMDEDIAAEDNLAASRLGG